MVFADLVDGNHIVVIDRGRGTRFLEKTSPRVRSKRRGENLQSDGAFELLVLGLEHHAHATGTQMSQHAVVGQSPQLVGLLRRPEKAADSLGPLIRGAVGCPGGNPGPACQSGREFSHPVDETLDHLGFWKVLPCRAGELDQRIHGIQLMERITTRVTGRQMTLDGLQLGLGQVTQKELDQLVAFGAGYVVRGGHEASPIEFSAVCR